MSRPSESRSSRRGNLLQAKLRGLVRARWGNVVDDAEATDLRGGAGLAIGGTVWYLAEDEPARSLGAALTWSHRHGGPDAELHLLTTGDAGALARRASRFTRQVTVWPIEGNALAADPAAPAPLPPEPPLDPRAEPFREMFERAGAEAIVEAGLLRAEVRGLEVARVEVDDEGAHVAVGVGKHDREAQREIRGNAQGFDELFEVVRIVAQHRVPQGEGHAAFHLASERWLRSVVARRPDLVGARGLTPVPSPVRREDLRHAAAAPAAGVDAAGKPLLVVCSVGTDVDLVPSAVDAWLADDREPGLVLCVPEGDDHRMTRDLVDALTMPARLATVPPDWRSL